MWSSETQVNHSSVSGDVTSYNVQNAIPYTDYSINVIAITTGNIAGETGTCFVQTKQAGEMCSTIICLGSK